MSQGRVKFKTNISSLVERFNTIKKIQLEKNTKEIG
jgi:hypothetical protein